MTFSEYKLAREWCLEEIRAIDKPVIRGIYESASFKGYLLNRYSKDLKTAIIEAWTAACKRVSE
jgi:hypothetical protein